MGAGANDRASGEVFGEDDVLCGAWVNDDAFHGFDCGGVGISVQWVTSRSAVAEDANSPVATRVHSPE